MSASEWWWRLVGVQHICASMPAGAASRYALGAGGVGATRPAPAASLISASRYALGARRSRRRCAPRALRACVPGGAHSRWLPSPPRATRSAPRWRAAPGAWAPIRQPGRGLALRARHQRRRRCTPERPHVLPRLRTLSPGDGGDVKDVVRFALLETLGATRASRSCRGRGWGGVSDIIMRKCAGERLRALYRSMCSVSRRGAPLQPERPTPRPGRPPAL